MTAQTLLDTGRVQVVYGESLDVLRGLPDGIADAIITDPPYSSGGQYRGDRAGSDSTTKYLAARGRSLPSFCGDSRDQRGYLAWCSLWMTEALRVASPGAILAVFCDWRQLPVTTDAVQAGGWVWRGIGAWHKPQHRRVQARASQSCEFVVWGTAGPRPMDYPGEQIDAHWSESPAKTANRAHPTEKPQGVLRSLVRLAPTDGLVIDPFAGSGSLGAAALAEGRRSLCVELHPEHARGAADRLAALTGETLAAA